MTSTHVTTSHRRISTRGAHRLRSQRPTHALINERTYAQGDQYTHHDQSLPNQYTRHTSTMVTTPNQYTITMLTPVQQDRTNTPPPPPPPPPTPHHKRQALRNLLRLIRSILPILGPVLSLLVSGIPVTNAPPRILIRVSDTRGRVLCSKCHGDNDGAFHFCQWCAAPSTYGSKTAILPCYVSTNTPLNKDLPSSRKPWRGNHPHAGGTPPAYYSNVSCNPE